MKLRVKGNSVRLRLTRPEVARLDEDGEVLERAEFGPEEILTYEIRAGTDSDAILATFRSGSVQVLVPPERIREWAASDEVGIYAQCGLMEVTIEKDFRCLTRPEEQWDNDVFPNPEEFCVSREQSF
jgi:hypothetical protein